MPNLQEQTRLRQNQRVASRVFDGLAEVITLDQPLRQHRLNAVGTRLWELSANGATVGELARRLSEEFAVDEGTARHDALAFCDTLVERGILVVEGAK